MSEGEITHPEIAAISSRLHLKKSKISPAIPVFGKDKLHSFSESNNNLMMAAEGTSETSYHEALVKTKTGRPLC
jgi:hypothetical protein